MKMVFSSSTARNALGLHLTVIVVLTMSLTLSNRWPT